MEIRKHLTTYRGSDQEKKVSAFQSSIWQKPSRPIDEGASTDPHHRRNKEGEKMSMFHWAGQA